MVPKSPRRLAIGIVVILVLSRINEVLCPSIEWRTRIAPMKVNSRRLVILINKPDNSFSVLSDTEGGAGAGTVVSNKVCRPQVGVDILLELLDMNLVKIDPGVRC